MARDVEPRGKGHTAPHKSGGLRPLHTLALVAVGVVGVLVAFWVLSAIAGLVWGLVKVVVIVAVLAGLLWFFLGRRRH